MAPHGHLPRTSYPEQPYDWSAPYDWAVEGVFDGTETPSQATTAYSKSWPYDWSLPYDWATEGIFDKESPVSEQDLRHTALRNIKDAAKVVGAVVLISALGALPAVVGKQADSDPDHVKENIPAALPKGVQQNVASAVKVKYEPEPSIFVEGSGVKIGPDLVLTAGHVVLGDNPDHLGMCGGSYTLNAYTRSLNMTNEIIDWTAIYTDSKEVAILRVSRDESFRALPTARIAANEPERGQALFFVNYESGEDGAADHYPNAYIAQLLGSEDEQIYGHPAQYAGTVVGFDGSDMMVATGKKSYGPRWGSETDSYPGGSGGPVFNRAGAVVGTLVRATMTEPGVSYVQPITKDLLQPHIPSLSKVSHCP